MKGKKNRLSRILSPRDGRGLIVAVDHGMALGPMSGLEDPAKVFEMIEPYADAWLMTKGIFTHVYEPQGQTGIILRASGGATIAGPDITRERQTASVEELLKWLRIESHTLKKLVGVEVQDVDGSLHQDGPICVPAAVDTRECSLAMDRLRHFRQVVDDLLAGYVDEGGSEGAQVWLVDE